MMIVLVIAIWVTVICLFVATKEHVNVNKKHK